MTYTPCTYCGTLDNAAAMTAGLCAECVANHTAGACDARVGSCDACNALTVHTATTAQTCPTCGMDDTMCPLFGCQNSGGAA